MGVKKVIYIVSLAAAAFFLSPSLSMAALSNEELLQRFEAMEKRVIELEEKLAEKEAARPTVIKEEAPGDIEERLSNLEEKSGVAEFLKGIEVHGMVDTSYIVNPEDPNPPTARTNSLRVFDTEANGFMLNLAELSIKKEASQESPVGFRVDMDFGDDAEVFGATGLGTRDDEFDLQQAYVHFYSPFEIPFMKDLNVKAGKFVTLHGAEVIESADNWNFSRSYLFGYAIPFTHTGIRANFKPWDYYNTNFTLGFVNGWDNVTDNNDGKTIELMLTVNPCEKLFLSIADIFGPEQMSESSNYRNVLDTVAIWNVCDRFTLMANYDFGYEDEGAGVDNDAWWSGIAGYAKYTFFDWWSIAGRGEFFRDRDGVRTGVAASMGITDLKVWELTLTNEFKIYKDLITRLEYRFDSANENVYNNGDLVEDYQNTFAVEAIYRF